MSRPTRRSGSARSPRSKARSPPAARTPTASSRSLLEEANFTAGGRKIEWIREFSNAQPDIALARTRKLVEQDDVDIVLGPLSGAEGIAVRDYSRTVRTGPSSTARPRRQDTTLRNPSPNFYRFNTDGTQWMAGLGEYVKNTLEDSTK